MGLCYTTTTHQWYLWQTYKYHMGLQSYLEHAYNTGRYKREKKGMSYVIAHSFSSRSTHVMGVSLRLVLGLAGFGFPPASILLHGSETAGLRSVEIKLNRQLDLKMSKIKCRKIYRWPYCQNKLYLNIYRERCWRILICKCLKICIK